MILLVKRLAFFFAVMGSVTLSQLPEFAQQYRQRLGGAIDEIARSLADFDERAERMRMTRAEGIRRFKANPDDFVRQQGEAVERLEARFERLNGELRGYAEAGPFGRLFAFAGNHDREIASRALDAFEPAMPVTSEGLLATVVGFFGGWALVRGLCWPLTRRRKRKTGLPAAEPVSGGAILGSARRPS